MAKSSENIKVKTVNEWLNNDDIPDGFTIANAKYRRDYHRLSTELRRQSLMLYVLGVMMGNYSLTKMMHSAKKQSAFCRAVSAELRHKSIGDNYDVFEEDVKAIDRRVETIKRITKEDIHLTMYEPFFNSLGDEIYEIEDYKEIPEMANKWNEEHKDIIEKHMMEIQPELERHNEFIRRKTEAIKESKRENKARKKAEDEYVKEIKANEKRNKAEYKKLERSFERYYEGNF